MGRKILIGILVAAAIFAVGYLPQYSRYRQARQQYLDTAFEHRLCAIRDAVSLTYLEATRKNFGIAAQHSTQYFNRVRDASQDASDPGLKSSLQELLAVRDKITSGLSGADPAVIGELQALVQRTFEITRP
ncbi:MAG: hypothetical protein LC130_20575 [Bryobacterales bacterium]|nr:hypothetical protein [Bryobacterales bacterium]MEB2360716.1 hypothetical protein [Bryobacterales bacterium]